MYLHDCTYYEIKIHVWISTSAIYYLTTLTQRLLITDVIVIKDQLYCFLDP